MLSDMEVLSTSEAAEHLGLTVSQFHHRIARAEIEPAFRIPGIRGAKFWHRTDVEALAAEQQAEGAA